MRYLSNSTWDTVCCTIMVDHSLSCLSQCETYESIGRFLLGGRCILARLELHLQEMICLSKCAQKTSKLGQPTALPCMLLLIGNACVKPSQGSSSRSCGRARWAGHGLKACAITCLAKHNTLPQRRTEQLLPKRHLEAMRDRPCAIR